MRIAYLAHLNDGHGSGVVAKVAAQLAAWRAAGHEARLYVATRDADVGWTRAFGEVSIGRYTGPVARLRAVNGLVAAIRRANPDVVYARWDLFYPPMLRLPPRLVVEVNTDDVAEAALGSPVRAAYNRATRGFWLRRAKALVFVASELRDLPAFRGSAAPRAVITNGVVLSDYPSLPAPAAPEPRLVFVGTGTLAWHGVDKLVRLAGLRPEWRFDVVGVPTPDGVAAPNVMWHGPLQRPQLIEVLATAHVGVGTLALHRKALREASPLKVREYLAVGLPVLAGYRDPDLASLGPYVLEIANTESNVEDELERIDAFVRSAVGLRVPRDCVANLDVTEKERQRLALFESVAVA